MITKILRLNIVHPEVRKVLEPWIFTWCRNPCLINKDKLAPFTMFYRDGVT